MRNLGLIAAGVILVALAVPSSAAKPGTSTPPSAMVFGVWPSTGPAGELVVFTPSVQTVSRTMVVPPDGAWFWGDAQTPGFVEMDCIHHYRGDLTPADSTYNPFFTAGILPPPYDLCSFNNCYTCRLDFGGQKPSSQYTTAGSPAFVPGGTRVLDVVPLNSGGGSDSFYLWIAQMNRADMSSMSMYQAVDENDPTEAAAIDVSARYFIANSGDRVPVVPVFHHPSGDFPAGPGVTYSSTWDKDLSLTSIGEEQPTRVTYGLAVVDIPIPKMSTGIHSFTLTAKLPSGKTFTSPAMTVFVYAQSIYITVDTSFDPKNPHDDLPNYIPGSTLSGTDVDLRNGPQVLQLNILLGRGSSGTFEVHLPDVSTNPGLAMNWPITNAGTEPDIDFGAGDVDVWSVTIPKGGAPKVVKLPLYVRDYAASATIEAVIPYRKTKYTTRRRIPLDSNTAGLPDAGWYLPTGVHIDKGNLLGGEDNDSALGIPSAGDGLTALEEYRGFFVAGQHVRTDPRVQDVFLDVDADFFALEPGVNAIQMLQKLPLKLHFVDPNDTASKNFSCSTYSVERIKPVVNPNRGNMQGAIEQRAVRVAYLMDDPVYEDTNTGGGGDLYTKEFGRMFNEKDDLGTVKLPYTGPGPAPPHHTQLVEYYARAFENIALSYGANGTLESFTNAAGDLVPDCAISPGTGCDVHDAMLQALRPSGAYLHTRRNPASDDYYTQVAYQDCERLMPQVLALPSEFSQLKTDVVAHEVSHGLSVRHNSDCLDLMFGDVQTGDVMSVHLPYPTEFSTTDLQGIILH